MKNFIQNLINAIKLIFFSSYEIDSKQVRREMYFYFNYHEWSYMTSITEVKVFKAKDHLIVNITTHRPGVLIGKAGTFINGLKDHLTKELNQKIEIELKESKIWHNLFS